MNSDEILAQYYALIDSGFSQRQACSSLNIPRTTMQRLLKRSERKVKPKDPVLGPRVLTLDVETAPTLYAGWGRFNQNFSQDNVWKEGDYLLTAAWKWQHEDVVHTAHITDVTDRWSGNDIEVVAALWDAIDQADVVIGQNVKRFDLGIIKARCALHGLPPFKTVKVIDTLHIARSMKFPSNSLDSLSSYLGIGRKTKHSGIALWLQVMQGCPVALHDMLKYNRDDVTLTEEVYMKLRAFNTRPINMTHYYDDNVMRCSVCGSSELSYTGNVTYTQVSAFKEVVCDSCGHRHRTRHTINTKEKRTNILLTPT